MAVRIRLKRLGRRNRPYYRICVFDQRTRRDGTPIEELGSYDPYSDSFESKVRLNRERALYWLNVGAQPSETVASMLHRAGVRKGEPLAVIPEAEAAAEAVLAGEVAVAPSPAPEPAPAAEPAPAREDAQPEGEAAAVPAPPEAG